MDGNNQTYESSGVNYNSLDTVKRLAQFSAKQTSSNLSRFGMTELEASRGDSAYVWDQGDSYGAFVIEGLGTKNLVADEMRKFTGRTYYDSIAKDTIAMIVNDLLVVGAMPQIINAYWAVGSSSWMEDEDRYRDLIQGWQHACNVMGAVWGGGETPTLKDIIHPEKIDLAGSALGIIKPKERLTIGNKLVHGDSIVLIESSGIHANGLTLARSIGASLPDGYGTSLPDGSLYGEALLSPTHLYSNLIENLFNANIDIHYMVNITGHGWRKLMRANEEFSYMIDSIPEPQPIFKFIQEQSNNSNKEMYGNFNMGAGFGLFLPEKYVAIVQGIAKERHGLTVTHAGYIESGEKKLHINPLGVDFDGSSLQVR